MKHQPVYVALSGSEFLQASMVGVMRQIQNIRAGRTDKHGCDPANGWTPHVEGACGEMAVAKCFGLFWSGAVGNLRLDDVGALQVRTAGSHTDRLILHPEDRDDRAFIHVTGLAPDFQIHGWMMGAEAKRPEWWSDPTGKRPAFFVPTASLRDLDTLHTDKASNRQRSTGT